MVHSTAKPAGLRPGERPVLKPVHADAARTGGVWERGGQNLFTRGSTNRRPSTTASCCRANAPYCLTAATSLCSRRCRDSARELARVVQPRQRQPNGLRHDGREFRQRSKRSRPIDRRNQEHAPSRHDRRGRSENRWWLPTAPRPMYAPTRPGRVSLRAGFGRRPLAGAHHGFAMGRCLSAHARTAPGRIGLPDRDVSARRAVFRGKVAARDVLAYFGAVGSPAASTYSPHGRPILTCRRRRRSIFVWSWKGRSRSCLIPKRCSSRRATRWCSAAPITPGATARAGHAGSPFPPRRRTMELVRGDQMTSLVLSSVSP